MSNNIPSPSHIDFQVAQVNLEEQIKAILKDQGKIIKRTSGIQVDSFLISLLPGSSTTKMISRLEKISEGKSRVFIDGKPYITVEVMKDTSKLVDIRNIWRSLAWLKCNYALPVALGKDTAKKNIIVDLAQMPHLLIVGDAGSGKRTCLRGMLQGFLQKLPAEQVRFLLIAPKCNEFNEYADSPYLAQPIIRDVSQTATALAQNMEEIERRSKILEEAGVKILREYNHSLAEASSSGIPYIVIAISNLAELMPISDKNKKIETAIAYIADKGGAVGIHLVIRSSSTDRNIITGLIHANFRTCISFRLRSKKESRSALYCSGAEKLGRPGDMLFQDIRNTRRIQGACFLE